MSSNGYVTLQYSKRVYTDGLDLDVSDGDFWNRRILLFRGEQCSEAWEHLSASRGVNLAIDLRIQRTRR